jgi:hypothetical protein
MNKARLSDDRIIELAGKYLAKYQPADYRIELDTKSVTEDSDGWWHVPIRPSRQDAPTFDWTGRNAEAAVDLEHAEGLHVVFL